MPPDVEGQGLDPLGLAAGQVVVREVPGSQGLQALTEGPLVEGGPPTLGDHPQRAGHARSADERARPDGLIRELGQSLPGVVVQQRQRTDEQR